MIVLGLLLILVAAGATVFALTAPGATAQTIEVTGLGFKVSTSPMALFFAGAVSLALLAVGYSMVTGGARRHARSRKELRGLRKEQAEGASAPAGTGQRPDGGNRSQKDSDLQTSGSTKAETQGSSGGSSANGNNRTAAEQPSEQQQRT
jgi:hypothetical protein